MEKSATAARSDVEIREEAYRAWKECGTDVPRTVRELKKQGHTLDGKTIRAWRDRYGWKERVGTDESAPRAAKEEHNAARLIADLETQKARYERFFQSLGDEGIDVQATYAYTSLVRAIADIRKKLAEKPDLYAMAPIVMDEFVKFIKGKGTEKDKVIQEGVFELIDRFFEEIEA